MRGPPRLLIKPLPNPIPKLNRRLGGELRGDAPRSAGHALLRRDAPRSAGMRPAPRRRAPLRGVALHSVGTRPALRGRALLRLYP
jgi:hypothetical protein